MDILELFDTTRERFPAIAREADALHLRLWDEVDPETPFLWFESLAGALNEAMLSGAEAERFDALFGYLADAFDEGDDEIRSCIDASFVENLFWEVPGARAEPFWRRLPENLRGVYMAFHGGAPL